MNLFLVVTTIQFEKTKQNENNLKLQFNLNKNNRNKVNLGKRCCSRGKLKFIGSLIQKVFNSLKFYRKKTLVIRNFS